MNLRWVPQSAICSQTLWAMWAVNSSKINMVGPAFLVVHGCHSYLIQSNIFPSSMIYLICPFSLIKLVIPELLQFLSNASHLMQATLACIWCIEETWAQRQKHQSLVYTCWLSLLSEQKQFLVLASPVQCGNTFKTEVNISLQQNWRHSHEKYQPWPFLWYSSPNHQWSFDTGG